MIDCVSKFHWGQCQYEKLLANCWRQRKKPRTQGLVLRVRLKKIKTFQHFTRLKSEVDKKLRVSFVICSQLSEFPRFLAYAPTHVVTFRASATATTSLRFIVFLSIFWTISSVVSYYESRVFEKKLPDEQYLLLQNANALTIHCCCAYWIVFINFPLALNWSSFSTEKPKHCGK